jgi:PAS domain S-box-containing protein
MHSTTFLDAVLENSPASLWISDSHGTLIRMNQACRSSLRLSDDEVVGKYNILADSNLEAQGLMPLVRAVFEKGQPARFTTFYDTAAVRGLELANSAKLVLDVSISPIRDGSGRVINAIIQHLDITERTAADFARMASESKLKAILENSRDAIGVHVEGRWVTCNPAAALMFGVASCADLIGKPVIDVIEQGERGRIAEFIKLRLAGLEAPSAYVTKGLRADGSSFDMEVDLSSYIFECRRHVLVILRDITERRASEAELQASFRENRAQLQELQHRAKNSFSMISNMIYFASRKGSSPETRAVLEDLDGRVRSVAELYSLLYSSGSLTEIRLDEYLTNLASALLRLSMNISLHTELESVSVSPKLAAPLGLIVTELMTNTLKHAFPSGEKGRISLSLRVADGRAILEVQDDGQGLPPGFEPGSDGGMGLELVASLAEQIGGRVAIGGGERGTRCRLDFEAKQISLDSRRSLPS